ncbi:heavy metal-binding domain-containing protein [bacterium]|nr:heavy metal-binding domain-containing protein [bacterium]
MPFWDIKKKIEEALLAKKLEVEREVAQEASLNALKDGDIPAQARHRLEQQAQGNPPLFTSSFSSKEHLLAVQAGYQPIGQVIGAAFITIDENIGLFSSGELAGTTQANRVARDFAIERMRKEASVLGADGVVGVRIRMTKYSWSENVVEFTASGTAVRVPGHEEWRQSKRCPFASTLSGQEFWQLFQGGYWPVGLVIGNCSYICRDVVYNNDAIAAKLAAQNTLIALSSQVDSDFVSIGSGVNEEIKLFRECFDMVRKLSMERMEAEINLLGACGVVDVDIDYKITVPAAFVPDTNYGEMHVEFMIMGTAVVALPVAQAPIANKPVIIFDLAKRERRSLQFDAGLNE